VGIRTKYYSVDHIKNNEIGGDCSTKERQKRYIHGVGGEGKSPLGRARIILK